MGNIAKINDKIHISRTPYAVTKMVTKKDKRTGEKRTEEKRVLKYLYNFKLITERGIVTSKPTKTPGAIITSLYNFLSEKTGLCSELEIRPHTLLDVKSLNFS